MPSIFLGNFLTNLGGFNQSWWPGNWIFAWVGLFAISIPIIIHLLNRRRFKTITWAAMDFLLRAMKKNRKRLRFEQLLLLATRCLLICLLGFALAQFQGCDNKPGGASARRPKLDIYIIDNSYSTSYQRDPMGADGPGIKTHLDKARDIADNWITEHHKEKGTRSIILTTAKTVATSETSATPDARPDNTVGEEKAEIAIAAVNRIEQSWNSADMKQALNQALEAASKDKINAYDKRLFIVSHSTRGKWDLNDNGFKQIGVQMARVFTNITPVDLADKQNDQWNGAVVDVQPATHLVSTKFWVDFRADVRGYFPRAPKTGTASRAVKLEWLLDDKPMPGGVHPMTLDGNAKPLPQTLSDVLFEAGGYHTLTVHLDDGGDHLQIDNVRHRVVDVASELKVLIVEGGPPGQWGGSAHFLETATNLKMSHYHSERIAPSELRQKALGDYVTVALVNVPDISKDESDALAAYVRQGGALVIFMGGAVETSNNKNKYNEFLYERHALLPGKLIAPMSFFREEYSLNFPPGFSGSSFKLAFNGNTTAPIPFSAKAADTAANIQARLSALVGIPAATVIAGSDNLSYTITFTVVERKDGLPQERATVTAVPANDQVVISAGNVTEGSNFDFKSNNAIMHPLLAAFANQLTTGLDKVVVKKYWQLDPDYLENSFKGFRDMQVRINAEIDALAHGTTDVQSLPPAVAGEQTGLLQQLKDFYQRYRDLGDSPADAQDPQDRIPPALAKLLAADFSKKPFAQDEREAVRKLLDGTLSRLESHKPERVLNYIPLKPTLPIDPAIVAQTVGLGRVVFLSTSANEEWTDFPHDPSYPELLFELLDGSLRTRDAWMNLTVGERLAIPLSVRGAAIPELTRNLNPITKVAEAKIPVFPPERDTRAGESSTASTGGAAGDVSDDEWRSVYHTNALNQPGSYTLTLGNRKLPIVVNVPAQTEADVTKIDSAAIGAALGGVKVEEQMNIQDPNRDYWGWLTLIAVLALAGFECFMAWKFGHYRQSDVPGARMPAAPTAGPRFGSPPPPMPGMIRGAAVPPPLP